MNKQAVIAIALLGLTGYSYAEERIENEAVQVTLEVRVDKDMADEVVAEAKKDASVLKEKYDSVCGIDAVRTVVKRGVKEEEITRSCSSSCKCKCKSCSSGSCCKCRSVESAEKSVIKRSVKEEEEVTRSCGCSCKCSKCSNGRCCNCKSVTIDDACSCEAQQDAEGTRAVCEACEKIKEGNERKRQRQRELQQQQQNKSVRTLKEDSEFCDCQIVHQKCKDCGNETSEFRCACGKPQQNAEEVVRCNCGGNRPKPDVEQ